MGKFWETLLDRLASALCPPHARALADQKQIFFGDDSPTQNRSDHSACSPVRGAGAAEMDCDTEDLEVELAALRVLIDLAKFVAIKGVTTGAECVLVVIASACRMCAYL